MWDWPRQLANEPPLTIFLANREQRIILQQKLYIYLLTAERKYFYMFAWSMNESPRR
jgi:hypothetical protein